MSTDHPSQGPASRAVAPDRLRAHGARSGDEQTARDLTEQRQFDDRLREAQRLESLGQLASGIAHNFNNALAAIIGYAELTLHALPAEHQVRGDVQQILAVAEQSAALTQQLLTFSRRERISPAAFDLNEAIEATGSLIGPLLGDRVLLRLELDRSLHDVFADRRQIEQVVANLVINARDAMDDGGTIAIETAETTVTDAEARAHPDAQRGVYARLTVRDEGTGMDRETMAHIFEPFFTTKEPGRGVGLGLSMVHGAIRQSGGFVTVDSDVGRGTTFRLHLPLHDGTAVGPTAAPRGTTAS